MLVDLRRRLQNDAATEIQVAAQEQARITALRLRALT
jgi:2-oxo-4-hydroxy-4-carboxy--5-ureidoimidazoline (OHCU) decarboxylase